MKRTNKKDKRRRHRWHWSFDRMHPVLQWAVIIAGALGIIFVLWAMSWMVYFARPELF